MKQLPIWSLVIVCLPAMAADLSGTYDVGTLTPLQRPEAFGDNLYLTAEQAETMRARMAGMLAADSAPSDPDRARRGAVRPGWRRRARTRRPG